MKAERLLYLQYLMLRFFEGVISEDEFAVLNQSLKESEAARQLYFSALKVYLAVKNVRYIDRVGQSDLDFGDFLDELGRYEHLAPPAIEDELEQMPVRSKKQDVEKNAYRFNKSSIYGALTALAAAILIIATIYFMPPRVTPYPVARVLDSSQAEWQQGEFSTSRTTLSEGMLEVTRGTLKFAMYDGTEVVLKAPATIELEEINRLYLHRGTMRAHVPPIATGFTVRTPSGSVVDFGTEFTVEVNRSGSTLVEVLRGIVELRDSPNPLLCKNARRLTVGQTGEIDPSGEITWQDPTHRYVEGETRIQWECPKAKGLWTELAYWNQHVVCGPTVVSEFRTTDEAKTVIVDDRVSGQDKIAARRADVCLLSYYPVTIQMDGGQVQLEQLWVGRMGQGASAEGRWIMSDGELVLKGRDQTMLFVGDKCKGHLEVNGGSIEIFGAARVGCNEGDGDYGKSNGTFVINDGAVEIYGILEVATAGSIGTVRLNGGRLHAFNLSIEKQGTLEMTGGLLILEGDKTRGLKNLIDAGLLQSPGREFCVEYDAQGTKGFGHDKTIVSVR